MSSVFDPLKYTVIKALNGKAGYEMVVNTMPDFVITDIMMPEMDGYELLKVLRNNQVISHIPVIILTGMTEERQKIKAFHLVLITS